MIAGYLNQIAKYEVNPVLYGWAPVLATLTLSPPFSMAAAFKVKYEISSGAIALNVTITGTLDGEPRTDTLEGFGPPWGTTVMVTSKQFDTVTEITTDIGENELNCRVVAADPTTEEELPGEWVEFSCRWVDKTSSYLKVGGDVVTGEIAVSDAKVLCEAALKDGDKVRLVKDGVDGIIYEVKKMKPVIGLNGAEEYRTLLLGGVGA